MSVSADSRLAAVAAQFPVLARLESGHPLCYLDSAATAQKPRAVIDAVSDFSAHHNASIHRGVYPLAVEATELFEGARERIASWLGSSVAETVFTKNATEAVNLVAYSWGRRNVAAGDLVVLTQMEHHSNIVPWQLLCAEVGARLEYVPVDDEGVLTSTRSTRCWPRGRSWSASCTSPTCWARSTRWPRPCSPRTPPRPSTWSPTRGDGAT